MTLSKMPLCNVHSSYIWKIHHIYERYCESIYYIIHKSCWWARPRQLILLDKDFPHIQSTAHFWIFTFSCCQLLPFRNVQPNMFSSQEKAFGRFAKCLFEYFIKLLLVFNFETVNFNQLKPVFNNQCSCSGWCVVLEDWTI